MVTTNPVFNDFEWFPNNNNDWGSEDINLNNYTNLDGVIIKFRNVNQYENNLFLDNINISSDGSTYINNDAVDNIIEIYPNPTDRYITVNYDGLKEIYTILGEKLLETYENKINVSTLAKGMYFVKVENTIIRLVRE